jgi:hypothetical protein
MDQNIDLIRSLKGKRKGGTIEDWQQTDPIEGHEYTGSIIYGKIVDDPKWGNTGAFRTSEVVKIHEKEGIVETRNTYYKLGKKFTPPVLTEEEKAEKQKQLDDAVETLRHFI